MIRKLKLFWLFNVIFLAVLSAGCGKQEQKASEAPQLLAPEAYHCATCYMRAKAAYDAAVSGEH